jgi:hypothetical protein
VEIHGQDCKDSHEHNMSILCALYIVKAGRGRIQVPDGCFGAETAGDAGWLKGREGPPSLRGTKRSKAVGIGSVIEEPVIPNTKASFAAL